MIDVEIRERQSLPINPVVSDQIDIRRAHQILKQEMHTV
jgi:hypothetical protein